MSGSASLRQISLHVVPGTGSYGSALFGMHFYTWAFVGYGALISFWLGSDHLPHPDAEVERLRTPAPPVKNPQDTKAEQPKPTKAAIEVEDASGQLVRRFEVDVQRGLNRVVWDLRRERPRALDYDYSIAALPGKETPPSPQGALVPPGSYEVRLTVDGVELRQPVTVVADPRVSFTAADYDDIDLHAALELWKIGCG